MCSAACTCGGHARLGEPIVFDNSHCPVHGPLFAKPPVSRAAPSTDADKRATIYGAALDDVLDVCVGWSRPMTAQEAIETIQRIVVEARLDKRGAATSLEGGGGSSAAKPASSPATSSMSDPAARALEKMAGIRERSETRGADREADHSEADDVLCELLTALGYAQVVSEFRAIRKWYA